MLRLSEMFLAIPGVERRAMMYNKNSERQIVIGVNGSIMNEYPLYSTLTLLALENRYFDISRSQSCCAQGSFVAYKLFPWLL